MKGTGQIFSVNKTNTFMIYWITIRNIYMEEMVCSRM